MPTARSGGVAVVHGGKIYVAGGPRAARKRLRSSTTRRPISGRRCRIYPRSATTSLARPSTAAFTSSAGARQRIVAPQNGGSRSLRPSKRRPGRPPPPCCAAAAASMASWPAVASTSGAARNQTACSPTMTTTTLGPTNGHASATCAHPRSRRQRLSLCRRSDLDHRWRHPAYRRQQRQFAQPGLPADSRTCAS